MVRFTTVSSYADHENNRHLSQIEGMCLSTDTKPTVNIATGSIMTEVDTGKVFFFNEASGSWVEQFSFQE